MKNKIILFLFSFILLTSLFFIYEKNKKPNKEAIFSYEKSDLILRVDRIRDIKIKKKHIKTPESVRAIYMSSWTASVKSLRSKLVKFIEESEINSLIIDIKDYSGLIAFDIDNTLINSYQTDSNRISDIDDFIKELHDKEIYIIGRVTVFQDPLLSELKPEFYFKRKDNGKVWRDKKGLAFIDPQKKEAWEYFAVIAEEAYKRGFDEINFDYIRYPSDGDINNLEYNLGGNTKLEAMKNFYIFLDKRLRSQNIPISADMFGHVASLDDGLTIGQNLYDALPYFDAIAPMVYPSHYAKNYMGFDNAAEHPYEVVYNEMTLAREKYLKLSLPKSSLRTWIQDFDLGGVDYGVEEVQDQIKASYDAGINSYMVWDPKNTYTKEAYYQDFSKRNI